MARKIDKTNEKWSRPLISQQPRALQSTEGKRVFIVHFSFMAMALAIIILLFGGSSASFAAGLSPVSRDAPTFSLADLSGKQWDNEALQGKPWLINLWASWCPPCVEELPSLNRAWDVLEAEGVGMLAINIGDDNDKLAKFMQKTPIDFPVLIGDPLKTLANWKAPALPTTVIIDSEGQVVYEVFGPLEWDNPEVLEHILALL